MRVRPSGLPPRMMSVPRPAMLVAMVTDDGSPACATTCSRKTHQKERVTEHTHTNREQSVAGGVHYLPRDRHSQNAHAAQTANLVVPGSCGPGRCDTVASPAPPAAHSLALRLAAAPVPRVAGRPGCTSPAAPSAPAHSRSHCWCRSAPAALTPSTAQQQTRCTPACPAA